MNSTIQKKLSHPVFEHSCDSSQGTDYIANDYIVLSSWI